MRIICKNSFTTSDRKTAGMIDASHSDWQCTFFSFAFLLNELSINVLIKHNVTRTLICLKRQFRLSKFWVKALIATWSAYRISCFRHADVWQQKWLPSNAASRWMNHSGSVKRSVVYPADCSSLRPTVKKYLDLTVSSKSERYLLHSSVGL